MRIAIATRSGSVTGGSKDIGGGGRGWHLG